MPPRRYQIPSPVSHASSASTLAPFVSRIITGPRLIFSPPLVETELELNSTCAEAVDAEGDGSALGDGDGSAEGDTLGTSAGREGKRGICCCVTPTFDSGSLELRVGACRVSP